jgi:hypothetical protein
VLVNAFFNAGEADDMGAVFCEDDLIELCIIELGVTSNTL